MDAPAMPATPAIRASPLPRRVEGSTVGKPALNKQAPAMLPTPPDAGFDVSFAKLVDVLSDRFDAIQTSQNEANHSLLRAGTKACQAPVATQTPDMSTVVVNTGGSTEPAAAGVMVNSAAPAGFSSIPPGPQVLCCGLWTKDWYLHLVETRSCVYYGLSGSEIQTLPEPPAGRAMASRTIAQVPGLLLFG
jgi:hypothetical protein